MTMPTPTPPVRAAEAPGAGRLVLAGVDTLHCSADIQISDAVHGKLDQEQEVAGAGGGPSTGGEGQDSALP